MDWPTIITILGTNIALFSWLRSDMKTFEHRIESWKEEINREMRDFHGRLCAIEEKNKGSRCPECGSNHVVEGS